MKNLKELGWDDLSVSKHYSPFFLEWIKNNQVTKSDFISHYNDGGIDWMDVEEDEIFLTYAKYNDDGSERQFIDLFCPIWNYYEWLAESHGDSKYYWEDYKEKVDVTNKDLLKWSLGNLEFFMVCRKIK